jgi:hypothetical protein
MTEDESMKAFMFAFLALALGAVLFTPQTRSTVIAAFDDPPPVCRNFPFCE